LTRRRRSTTQRSETTESQQRIPVVTEPSVPSVPGLEGVSLTPEQKILSEKFRQLIEAATTLVIKVAACPCDKTESCGVFQKAKTIATVVDEIQELRTKEVT